MRRHRVFPVGFAWLLAVTGGGWLALGADLAGSTETNAAFADHLARLRVPDGFTVVVQPPFVVIGDEPPAQVRLAG
jgi:hypothetical protein